MEYLIANGAERVIEELREQAYQIQVSRELVTFFTYTKNWTLACLKTVCFVQLMSRWWWWQALLDFQYMEPNGKDQGLNVQKKARSLLALINDRGKIRELREKAAANRDK
jgi:epsin